MGEYNLEWLKFLQCLKEKKEFEGFFKATARRVVAPYNTMSEICRNQRLPPRGSCHEVTEGVSRPQATESTIYNCCAKSKTPPVSFADTLLGEEGSNNLHPRFLVRIAIAAIPATACPVVTPYIFVRC